MNKIEIVDGQRVMTLPDGNRIRPDRFVTSSCEGIAFEPASAEDEESPPVTDDEVRELFHPDLICEAGL